MAGKAVNAMVGGGGHSELERIFHIMKHVAHELKETAEDVLEGPDKNNEGKNG
jgi:hypothetical protein